MLVIGEIFVEPGVTEARFRCDLPACKGACCTLEGGRGAPLSDDEARAIDGVLPAVRRYLSPRHLDELDRRGGVEGEPGSYATRCVDDRACVFVSWDGDIARCAIELAHRSGDVGWRKPISCHLFPLRYTGGADGVLRYEEIPECGPGRRLGRAEHTPLAEFLREPLIRRFGEAWVGGLTARADPGHPERTFD